MTAATGPIRRYAANTWEHLAGGILPVVHRPVRTVHVMDGTTYELSASWLWFGFKWEIHAPWTPRKIRRAREAEMDRIRELSRRALAGEALIRAGDQIPPRSPGLLDTVVKVHDGEGTLWKRAVGEERYARDDVDGVDRGQEYDWVAFLAGQWGSGWRTDEGMLDYAPLTVVEVTG